MDFGIAVKVDPNGALPAIKRVEDGLTKAEQKAKEASKAMTSGMRDAARAFGSVGAAIQQQQDALKRMETNLRKLPLQQAAQGFAKLAEAIEHQHLALKRCDEIHDPFRRNVEALTKALGQEAEMMERIHGPAKQFAQDVMTLDRLLAQGRINANQYADAFIKMGANAETAAQGIRHMTNAQKQQAAQMIGLPSPGGRPSAMSGVTKGTLVAAGGIIAAPVAAADVAVSHVENKREEARTLKDEYIAMTNAARKFAHEEGRQVNEVLDEQFEISRKLRQSFGPTVALYDDVGDATEKLGLTHREHIKLMERLGKAAVVGNKEIGVAGDFMKRLALTMELGKDAGKQLEGMMRELPEVSKIWVDKYGGDSQAFVAAVESGKESYASLVDTIIVGSSEIESAFDRNQRSHAQWKTAVREEEIRLRFGSGFDAQNANQIARARVNGTASSGPFTASASTGPDIFGAAKDMRARAMRQAAATADKQAAEAVGNVLGALSGVVDDLGTHAQITANRLDTKFNSALDETAESTSNAHRELTAYEKLLEEIRGPQERAIEDLTNLFEMWGKGTISLEEYNRATEKRRDLLLELGVIEMKSMTGGMRAAPIDLSGVSMPTPRDESKSWLQGHIKGYADEGRRANFKIAQDAKKAAAETRDAWASAAGSIIGDFARMGMEGEMTFGTMLEESLRKAAMLALTLAAGQLGGGVGAQFASGLFGALGGGRNGFDHVLTGHGDMPGFRDGGDAMIKGKGPQDSIPVAFWGSAGESLHVRTPQQRMAEQEWARQAQGAMRSGGSPGKVTVNAVVSSDPREVTAAMGTYEGRRAAVRLNRAGHWRR